MRGTLSFALGLGLWLLAVGPAFGGAGIDTAPANSVRQHPPALESYGDSHMERVGEVLRHRIRQEPLNLWATLLFLAAVGHTFVANRFKAWAHAVEERHRNRWQAGRLAAGGGTAAGRGCPPSMLARVLHYLGEVEVVFGVWTIPLFLLLRANWGSAAALGYLHRGVSFEEPVFVVVIMTMASTRPVLRFADQVLRRVAGLGGGTPAAWWFAILSIGPVLGSFITEPAAMTICAQLLARQFFALRPRPRFAYATLGLLFCNVSIGGVLTHFAAPPVLMVAKPWGWDSLFMARHFGWIAVIAILVSNTIYFLLFRGDFRQMSEHKEDLRKAEEDGSPVPAWITLLHLAALAWAVLNVHYPVLLVCGFLFFVALHEITAEHQSVLQLRPAMLVGFFLAGLVVHGGLQGWWIAPVLSRLGQLPLMLGAAGLTAFNDNAAITYLATLVPGLAGGLKYAVMAGAVAGGGLTVIANAPNPAGQAILARFFPEGVSPLGLLLGALLPTMVAGLAFAVLGGLPAASP